MRFVLTLVLMLGASALFQSGAGNAQDKQEGKKDVVLKGKVTCGKCDLMVDKKCATVIVVKDATSKKDVVYYFDQPSHAKFHDGVCTEAKNGSVEGPVREEGKKKIISVKKVTYE